MALDRYGDVLPRSILKPRSAGDGNAAYVALSFADEPDLIRLQDAMRRSGIKAEWQDPGLFHCSLLIVEDATDEQLNGLLDDLSLPVRFWVEVASLGTFEADDIPLIANVVANPALIRLQQEFGMAAVRLHLPVFEFFRATAWKPHITLAYDSDADIETLPPMPVIIKLRAEAVLLMRDDYNVVRRILLPETMPDRAFIEAGGKGSGHFGHAGIPGHQGGSLPSGEVAEEPRTGTLPKLWAEFNHPGDTIVYHTRAQNRPEEMIEDTVATIKAQGIRRGAESIGRPPSVYFTSNQARANMYGFILGRRNLQRAGVESPTLNLRHFVIIEFSIPDSVDDRVYEDYSDNDLIWDPNGEGKSFRIETDIPPEWIRSVTPYDIRAEMTATGPRTSFAPHQTITRTAPDFGYVVIFVAEASDPIQRHYGPGPHPGTGTDQSVHGGGATIPNKNGQVDGSLAAIERQYPEVEEAERVDGREVRGPASNWDSVGASLSQWESLAGYRIVKMSQFTDLDPNEPPRFYSRELRESTEELARAIKASQWIEPLIVAVDDRGPWVIEGSHRFDALRILKAKAFPAIVVIDREALPDPDVVQRHYGPGTHPGTGTDQSVHGGGDISGEARLVSGIGPRRAGSRARYKPVIAEDGLARVVDMPQTQTWRAAWESLAAIDQVHRMPNYIGDLLRTTMTPGQLPIRRNQNARRSGGYWQRRGNGAKKIEVDPLENLPGVEARDPLHPQLTTAHEIGHFLDNVVFGGPTTGRRATSQPGLANVDVNVGEQFGAVIRAMEESRDYQRLQAQNLTDFAIEGESGRYGYSGPAIYRVRQPLELFARGYAQWITLRSRNATMRTQVDERNAWADRGAPRMQWQWDDFEPIAGTYDRLFQAAGLLRSTP